VYCSPLRRSRQTAQSIADALDVRPIVDPRATERMNWDGSVSFADFSAEWARTVEDRSYKPAAGDSSRAAAERLLALVREVDAINSPVAIVTHGGVTVDVLRTLLGDNMIDEGLFVAGLPSCAITTLHGTTVISVAAVDHLAPAAGLADGWRET
jgi:broad specificity phosphatase PhoE